MPVLAQDAFAAPVLSYLFENTSFALLAHSEMNSFWDGNLLSRAIGCWIFFGRYNSCCLMFSQSALEISCAWFLLCLCNNCICKFCVFLHLQRLYLVFLCVFVFATIVFGNDTGSLPALAFDCRAAASSVDGTPEKKINVSASRGSIQDLKSREAKYR